MYLILKVQLTPPVRFDSSNDFFLLNNGNGDEVYLELSTWFLHQSCSLPHTHTKVTSHSGCFLTITEGR